MGTIYVEVVSADIVAFLSAANGAGLELRNVEMPDALTVRFEIGRASCRERVCLRV